ncbi:MFS transporter [Desulfuromonas thiophila]|uniref:MFS transporter n=1 Tax=Desulfuromonas thiophila TaxID=57664 RepID=UPI0024A95946|nr:MFS transporter [Desulfuromonas thiophila]
MTPATSPSPHIHRSSPDYWRANLALFFAGFVTFSSLYCLQPLLPNLVAEFAISPARASLSLSLTTLALAAALPVAGSLSDALGRRRLIGTAMLLASLMALACLWLPSLAGLLTLRLLQGLVLAGIPAIAMAYLSEEMAPAVVGGAMGLYIAGNAIGGMTGRILTAWLADWLPWRQAVAAIGLIGLLLTLAFWWLLPPSRRFCRRALAIGPLSRSLLSHLRQLPLLCLFVLAFCCMGAFICLYNYISFRLLAPPFNLSQSQVALIFVSYAFGAFGSRQIGRLGDRWGRAALLYAALLLMALGALATLARPLPLVAAGIIVLTIGFFGAHTTASTWVGQLAGNARAQASALYLLFYYLGSSIAGTLGGMFFARWHWPGVIGLILLQLMLATGSCLLLGRLLRRYD